MSTYKVIQDIEAEDKLVGPLSFRQFVYFLIAAFLGYLCFISVAKGAAFLLIIFFPPMAFCLFFAFPWTPDQPTEVWALARLRFLVKSRKRVWDQSGVKEFVTVTVPKKIERTYTDGLSQSEVRSRLGALASTLDSRGWAVKNAYLNDGVPHSLADNSDRLVNLSAMPQEVSNFDIRPEDDILDERNNNTAYHMDQMVDASAKARRQQLEQRMQAASAPVAQQVAGQNWFATPAGPNGALPPVAQDTTAGSIDLDYLPSKPQSASSHLKIIQPGGAAVAQQQPATIPTPLSQLPPAPVPTPQPMAQPAPVNATASQPDAAILNLAHDNNMDVATLAREAKRAKGLDTSEGEVVISLR